MKKNIFKITILVLVSLMISCAEKQEKVELVSTYKKGFKHPTQVLIYGDTFIVAEMQTPILYRVKTLDKITESDKEFIGSDSNIVLNSPHFMTISNDNVYVTEGRGSNIASFSLTNSQDSNRVLSGELLNRPHGICFDKKGWMYITDSVNSRLVRVNDKTKELQVFEDKQKRIAYGRQILCRDDGIWLSNSYEKAFQLNQGTGSNILKISDFDSGESEIVIEYKDTNMTGLAVLDNRYLVVGRWNKKFDVVLYDLKLKKEVRKLYVYDKALDAPYGITVDEKKRKFYIAFLGLGEDRSEGKAGGVKVFSY